MLWILAGHPVLCFRLVRRDRISLWWQRAFAMTAPRLILTLLPPPLSIDHAVLYVMGQPALADPRHGTVGGIPVRPGFDPGEATRAVRMAMSAVLSRLSDVGVRHRVSSALTGRRQLYADELRPSLAAVRRVGDLDPHAARAITELAVIRLIAPLGEIVAGHPIRALTGRVLLVDVDLIAQLCEIADPGLCDQPGRLKDLLFDNFGAACVLHFDASAVPPPRLVAPAKRERPHLQLVT